MGQSPLTTGRLVFEGMIGTGGIGTGHVFALDGNETLGREESRGGRFMERRDYCKLHIVSHYCRQLLGGKFQVIPIGVVGDDDAGRVLLSEMEQAGLRLKRVEVAPGEQTLYSFCYVYPDGSGGNMTTSNSACALVTRELVMAAEADFANFGPAGVAVALPEVPMAARVALLELATKYDMLRIGSFTSQEIPEAIGEGLHRRMDLMALNLDEAAAVVGGSQEGRPAKEIVEAAAWKMGKLNGDLVLSITAGAEGSWVCAEGQLVYHEPCRVEVASTAGAGDAFLSGLVSGLVCGLSLSGAQQLGTLVAGASVTSTDTIHFGIGRELLHELALQCDWGWDPGLPRLLNGPAEPQGNETQKLRKASAAPPVPLNESAQAGGGK